jgi:membrane associated rhomboid family serine protease
MFIPFRDVDNPVRRIRWPFVSHAIIATNVVVFLLINLMSAEDGAGIAVLLSFRSGVVETGAALPFAHVILPGPLAALTSAFVHVDAWHLLGNMLCLWVFADNVEDALGHGRFALFYALAAVAAAYAQAFASEPGFILYGASGAVSAVIAAFVILHPHVRLWVLVFMKIPLRLSAMWVIGAWILFQIYNIAAGGDDGIGWWAHVGGMIVGAALLPLMKRRGVTLFDRGPDAPA